MVLHLKYHIGHFVGEKLAPPVAPNLSARTTLPKPHYPSPCTITLGSLAKGELLLLSQAQPTIEGSFAPSLNPDRSAIPQKSATLSKVGTIRLHCRPPSTQLKPISIFLKGKFAAAHSRKVGIVSGDLPQNLHSTNVQPRPSHYPTKIRNIIKGRNLPRPTGAYSCSAKL